MMSNFSLVFLLLTPLWTFLIHAASNRTSWGAPLARQKLTLLCCLLTVVLVTMIAGMVDFVSVQAGGQQLSFVAMVALLLSHVYFHLFNMSETARRIRIVLEVAEGRGVREAGYDNLSMVRVRLERLKELGQIEARGAKLRVRKTWFTYVCRIIRWHEKVLFPQRFRDTPATTALTREPA